MHYVMLPEFGVCLYNIFPLFSVVYVVCILYSGTFLKGHQKFEDWGVDYDNRTTKEIQTRLLSERE